MAVNDRRQFLLTLRNEPKNRLNHLKWQIPGGGMEAGERPHDTLLRELKEELGVQATVKFPYPMTRHRLYKNGFKQTHLLLLCYLVDIGSQRIVLDQKEGVDYKWVDLEGLDTLPCFKLTVPFLREADAILTQYSL